MTISLMQHFSWQMLPLLGMQISFNCCQTGQYPPGSTPKKKCRLLFKSRPYSLLQGHLYRYGHDGISRKCAYPHEVSNLVADAHDGAGAGHYPGYIVAQRILHSGMWWPTLFKDCITYANACDTCQRCGPKPTTANLTSLFRYLLATTLLKNGGLTLWGRLTLQLSPVIRNTSW